MRTSMSSFSPTGRLLARVYAQAASTGIKNTNLNFTSTSKNVSPRIAKETDENGNTYFFADKSEVDGDSVVS